MIFVFASFTFSSFLFLSIFIRFVCCLFTTISFYFTCDNFMPILLFHVMFVHIYVWNVNKLWVELVGVAWIQICARIVILSAILWCVFHGLFMRFSPMWWKHCMNTPVHARNSYATSEIRRVYFPMCVWSNFSKLTNEILSQLVRCVYFCNRGVPHNVLFVGQNRKLAYLWKNTTHACSFEAIFLIIIQLWIIYLIISFFNFFSFAECVSDRNHGVD